MTSHNPFVKVLVAVLVICVSWASLVSARYDDEDDRTKCKSWGKVFLDSPLSLLQKFTSQPKASDLEFDSTERLAKIRAKMENKYDLYLIPMNDAHDSEYVSEHDKRIQYATGFTGTAGFAMVTINDQIGRPALFVDARYFLQADYQVDCNWNIMKKGLVGVPLPNQWIGNVYESYHELHPDAEFKIGFDSRLLSIDKMNVYLPNSLLKQGNISLVPTEMNIIDSVWEDQPPQVNNPIYVHELQYSGMSIEEKLNLILQRMEQKGAHYLVLSKLDEIAWLTSLRGSDIKYNPVFLSFAVIERLPSRKKIILFLQGEIAAHPIEIRNHLSVNDHGECKEISNCYCEVKGYHDFYDLLGELTLDEETYVWVPPTINFGAYKRLILGGIHIIHGRSPVSDTKMIKNDVEVNGMRNAQLRDSAALIEFLAELEQKIEKGEYVDEMSAGKRLAEIRSEADLFRSLSFASISSVGSNAAIIHYKSTPETNRPITKDEIYLLDSGGNYLDGTTDVTRTFHFGTPTAKEKEAYTLVLQGQINVAMAVWPHNFITEADLDTLARIPLWRKGLEYWHGTGHGIGAFLNVHEGPNKIDHAHGAEIVQKNMFYSDEPGYYEDGKFGIRLENIIRVTDDVPTKYDIGIHFMGFETLTLVPYEPNLIDFAMLDPQQINWLNDHNKKCLQKVGEIFKTKGKHAAYDWLERRTLFIGSRLEPVPILSGAGGQASAYIGSSSGIYSIHQGASLVPFMIFVINYARCD